MNRALQSSYELRVSHYGEVSLLYYIILYIEYIIMICANFFIKLRDSTARHVIPRKYFIIS